MIYKKELKIFLFIWLMLLIFLYIFKNCSILIRIASYVSGFFIFHFFGKAFNFEFKKIHYIYIFIILTFGILFSPLYYIFSFYDKVLHLILPIIGSIIIFYMVNKLNIKFSLKLLTTFSFSLAILSGFEMGEYLLDQFLNLKLQGVYLRDYSGIAKLKIIQDKNDDTMIDLILGMLGSLIFVGAKIGIYYYKKLNRKTKSKN